MVATVATVVRGVPGRREAMDRLEAMAAVPAQVRAVWPGTGPLAVRLSTPCAAATA